MAELTDAVMAVIAEAEHTTPRDLPALEEWVPATTTETLHRSRGNRAGPVTFTYLWYHVTVSPQNEITITPG